jgi:Fur family transcriptional regulator, ferric uptake regulator
MKKIPQARAKERLRAHGARLTDARVRVLASLLRAERALSHHELEALLAPIDKVTLYRVLDWMVAQGLAHRVAGLDRAWRFAAVETAHADHAHFQCSRCGDTRCLSEVRLPRRSVLAVPRGYRPEGLELTVKGACPSCA